MTAELLETYNSAVKSAEQKLAAAQSASSTAEAAMADALAASDFEAAEKAAAQKQAAETAVDAADRLLTMARSKQTEASAAVTRDRQVARRDELRQEIVDLVANVDSWAQEASTAFVQLKAALEQAKSGVAAFSRLCQQHEQLDAALEGRGTRQGGSPIGVPHASRALSKLRSSDPLLSQICDAMGVRS